MSTRTLPFLASLALAALAPLFLIALPGCEDKESTPAPSPAPGGTFNAGTVTIPTGGACNVVVAEQVPYSQQHVLTCSYVPYDQSNPPSNGPHYPTWAAFKTYDAVVPRGFLVHDLEHGGVVFSYDCPEGCAAEVAKAQKVIDAAVDPKCPSQPAGNKRITMSPDPLLDTAFALSAWGHTLTASCVDEVAFAAFVKAYIGEGPEDVCGGGTDVLATALPAKCGEIDYVPLSSSSGFGRVRGPSRNEIESDGARRKRTLVGGIPTMNRSFFVSAARAGIVKPALVFCGALSLAGVGCNVTLPQREPHARHNNAPPPVPQLSGRFGDAPFVARSALMIRVNEPATGSSSSHAGKLQVLVSEIVIFDRPTSCAEVREDRGDLSGNDRSIKLDLRGRWPLPTSSRWTVTHVTDLREVEWTASFQRNPRSGVIADGELEVLSASDRAGAVRVRLHTINGDGSTAEGVVPFSICP